MKELNSNGSVCVMSPKKEQHTDISTLTVAEAEKLGYKLLSPGQTNQLAGLIRKEISNRAIDKEYETFFKNTNNTSETSIGAVTE